MNKVTVREATLEELALVNQQIEEFITPYDLEVITNRLAHRHWYGLVAAEGESLLGFKVGYAESKGRFYSWLGGVIPAARGRGVARALLKRQEKWVREHEYTAIHVKSRNRYRAMLQLLLSEGYDIVDVEVHDPTLDSRIHFLKSVL